MSRRLVIAGVASAAVLGAVVPSFAQTLPPSPVTVVHNDQGTGASVGEVGVWISNNGRVCPLVSTQDWQCVGGQG